MKTAFLPAALACLALAPTPSYALALGLPDFTVTGTVGITNEFGPDNFPTPSYAVSMNGVVTSSSGAPALLGQTLNFHYFVDGGANPGVSTFSFILGGNNLPVSPFSASEFVITPPYTSSNFDPVTGNSQFDYSGIFAGFGPRIGQSPDINLVFSILGTLPTKDGFQYCSLSFSFCEFSNTPGLTTLNGEPVDLNQFTTYPEGVILGGQIRFQTVDGRASVVPLPAAGLLLASGLAGLGVMRRRQKKHKQAA
jgi:hypothetical protein